MNDKNQKFLVYAVILFIVYMWWRKRPSRASKCSSIWNTACTECRQLFFEINSDIDNNSSLLASIQATADEEGSSLWNAKVHYILNEMVLTNKITSDKMMELEVCMMDNESSLRIAK